MLSNLFESKSEARRLIQQNGIKINGEKVTDIHMMIGSEQLDNNTLLIQKGKKTFKKILFK